SPRTQPNPGRSQAGDGQAEFAVALPHAAAVLAHHGLAGFAAERLLEFRYVHHQAVHAIFARRVLIRDGVSTQVFRTLVLARPLPVADKETLIGRKAIAIFQLLAFGLHLPGHVSQYEAAEISHIFAFSQLAVDLNVVDDCVLRILVNNALGA